VVAAIRHRHTKYDPFLMKGFGQMYARDAVRSRTSNSMSAIELVRSNVLPHPRRQVECERRGGVGVQRQSGPITLVLPDELQHGPVEDLRLFPVRRVTHLGKDNGL
jgi:hypothetical protein